MSSTIAPTTGRVGLAGRVEYGGSVVIHDGGDDAPAPFGTEHRLDAVLHPAVFRDGIRIEPADDRSCDIAITPSFGAGECKAAVDVSSYQTNTGECGGFNSVPRVIAAGIIDDQEVDSSAAGIFDDAGKTVQNHVRISKDGNDQGYLCAGSFH